MWKKDSWDQGTEGRNFLGCVVSNEYGSVVLYVDLPQEDVVALRDAVFLGKINVA